MPIPYRLFQKIEKEDISQFYKASVALMSKPDKDIKGEKKSPIFFMNIDTEIYIIEAN